MQIDKENGNDLWQKALQKEMNVVKVAFKMLNDGDDPPAGYSEMGCHIIFDVKMENFRRKCRLVADAIKQPLLIQLRMHLL